VQGHGTLVNGYDDFNRLLLARSGTNTYSYSYDRYGNRWQQLLNGSCTAGTASCLTFDANNHESNGLLSYDAAGNVISDNMHFYSYDAESRLINVDSGGTASYIYDANGRRVRKTVAGLHYDYLYDLSAHVITVFTGGWARGEVYLGNRHLATYVNDTTYFVHADWLGTERARTTVAGAIYETCTSLPFGDNLQCSTTDPSPLHFTGKERDSESGLDNFGARYNSSSFGRFTSPDEPFYRGRLDNAQELNLYSYALNNPVSKVDPDGHDVIICLVNELGGQNCVTLSDDQYRDLYKQQNGQDGVSLPGGKFPGGEIFCSGVTCGTAEYRERELDPADNFVVVGAVGGAQGAGELVGFIRTAATALDTLLGRSTRATPGVTGGKATFQDLLQGAVRDGGSRSEIWSKPGGYAQATKDFESLDGTSQNLGRVQIKDLPDGQGRAVLRNFSSDGRPTLELQPAGGGYKGTAIRYNQ
jgi:RHS repeat-associated protein